MKKDNKYKRTCDNFWCKAPYMVDKDEFKVNPKLRQCPKCCSFDEELSGGVVNNGDMDFPGERFDGKAHPTKITFR